MGFSSRKAAVLPSWLIPSTIFSVTPLYRALHWRWSCGRLAILSTEVHVRGSVRRPIGMVGEWCGVCSWFLPSQVLLGFGIPEFVPIDAVDFWFGWISIFRASAISLASVAVCLSFQLLGGWMLGCLSCWTPPRSVRDVVFQIPSFFLVAGRLLLGCMLRLSNSVSQLI